MADVDGIQERLERSKHLDTGKQIAELCSIRDQLDSLIGRLTVEYADSGEMGETRFSNPASWLAAESNRAKRSTTRWIRHARLIQRFAGIAEGVDDDTLTPDHLDMLVRMVPIRRTMYRAEMFREHHRQLVQLARQHDYVDWVRLCRAWIQMCDDADPHATAPEDKDLGIDFNDNLDGTTSIAGLVLTTDAIVLKEALMRLADQLREQHRRAESVDRSDPAAHAGARVVDPDRDADGDQVDYSISEYTLRPVLRRGLRYFMARAVAHLAERGLVAPADGKTPEPLLVLLLDFETFTAEKDRWARGDSAGGPDPVFRPGFVCQTLDGDPVGIEQAFRVALDHRVARCVIDSASRRVDLGRTQRMFVGAARDAVVWRDRHCQHPRCRRPARWCDIDHLIEWQDGGHTDPCNGQLLCNLHHRQKTEAEAQQRRHRQRVDARRRELVDAEPF